MTIAGGISLRACRACGLVFHTDFASAQAARDHYAHYYKPDNLAFSSVTERRYQTLVATFESFRATGRILDVGCGSGHLLSVAGARGWEAHGTEVARGLTDHLSALGIRSFGGELVDAGYPADGFDIVHCSEVIEHVFEPASLLREMHRVLRPGGLLYLTTPNYNSVSRRILGAKWRGLSLEHICYFTPSVLTAALTRTGFEALRVTTRNIDPNECRKLFRRATQGAETGFQAQATDELRRQLDTRPAWRLMKRVVNRALSATSSGDTIIARALKGRAGR
jgi:2-polyprenyl-3-methyl-5-hydroxy-6-metoxy-1,4-benzoquinol methylase